MFSSLLGEFDVPLEGRIKSEVNIASYLVLCSDQLVMGGEHSEMVHSGASP